MNGLIFLRPECSAWTDSSEHNLLLSFLHPPTTVGLLYANEKSDRIIDCVDTLKYNSEQCIVWAVHGEAHTTWIPVRNETYKTFETGDTLTRSIVDALHDPRPCTYLDRIVGGAVGLVNNSSVVVHTGASHTVVNIISHTETYFWYIYYKGNAAIFFSSDKHPDTLNRIESLFHYRDMRVGAAVHITHTPENSIMSLNLEYLRGKHRRWLSEFRNNILTMTSTQDYLNTRTKQIPKR